MRRAAKTPLTGDKIDAPAAYGGPFRPYCGGVVTRTQNVSEYMPVLAVCLVLQVLLSVLYLDCLSCLGVRDWLTATVLLLHSMQVFAL